MILSGTSTISIPNPDFRRALIKLMSLAQFFSYPRKKLKQYNCNIANGALGTLKLLFIARLSAVTIYFLPQKTVMQ
jgi:hypothetical protein